jgi:hypothetical protein
LPRAPAAIDTSDRTGTPAETPRSRIVASLLQPLNVVGRSEVRNQLVAELPDTIRQVLARGEGGEERDSGLHFTLAVAANNRRVLEFLGAESTGRLVISSILRPRWNSFFGQRHDRPNTLLVRFLPAALIGW